MLCGWVSDRPWADALLLNNIALMIGGAATIASPFCINYGMFATYAAIFGLGIGKILTLIFNLIIFKLFFYILLCFFFYIFYFFIF